VAHLLYFAILGGCLVMSAPLEVFLGARVYRRPVRLACAVLPVAAAFVIGDAVAVQLGWWGFSGRYVVAWPRPLGLPVEEVLFFVVVPVCAVLTLEAVRRLRPGWFIDG
jgi:lycopene cyclase domain-containing protein